jgi:hypothetical protein
MVEREGVRDRVGRMNRDMREIWGMREGGR